MARLLRLSLMAGIVSCAMGLICITPSAQAIGPHGDVYAGASFPTVAGQYGWEASAHLKMLPLVGIEADFGGYGYGLDSSVARTYTYLVGPRVTAGFTPS